MQSKSIPNQKNQNQNFEKRRHRQLLIMKSGEERSSDDPAHHM
jgi:hypothetical protein